MAAISIFKIVWVAYILIGDTGTTGEFELTVGKRRTYAVSAEGWRVVSGAEIEAGEAVTIVVDQF